MNYIINHREYKLNIKYIQEDHLYEATLTPDDEEPAVISEFGYGETKSEAIKELSERLFERGLKERVDNYYLPWETLDLEVRRKIIVYSKGVKSDLLGEWMTDGDRYEKWRSIVLTWTTKNYGYTTPFTYRDYRRL